MGAGNFVQPAPLCHALLAGYKAYRISRRVTIELFFCHLGTF